MINDTNTEERRENEEKEKGESEKSDIKDKPSKPTRSPVRRLKEYLFPSSKKSSEEKKKSEQSDYSKVTQHIIDYESKVDQVRTYLEELEHPLETAQIEMLLEMNDWNVAEVAEYCKDLCDAEEGLVADLQKNSSMLGAENDQSTSCYIGN